MVDLLAVDEVSSVDSKLVVRIELALQCVICRPRIRAITLEHEHAVIDGGLSCQRRNLSAFLHGNRDLEAPEEHEAPDKGPGLPGARQMLCT